MDVVVVVGGGSGGMLVYHVKRDIHARNRTHGVGLERRSARWGCCGGGCGGFNWKKKKENKCWVGWLVKWFIYIDGIFVDTNWLGLRVILLRVCFY